jgi:hypothetical protein
LILVVLGAAAFFVWKYVIDTAEEAPAKPAPTAVQPPAPAPTKPEPPKPPPPAKAKLSSEPVAPDEIKVAAATTVEAIEANDKVVKAGDTIVWLAGAKKLNDEITPIAFDVEKRYPGDIAAAEKERDTAKAANNAAGVTAAEKKIDDRKKALDTKQQQLDTKRADLDKLLLKALSAGKLSSIVKAGAKVNANDVVAKIAREPVATATFDVKGSKVTVGSAVKVFDDKSPEKGYDCSVAEVSADKVKITCGSDPTLDGVDVTFKP